MAAPINLQANLQLNTASINASAKQVEQALGRITGQASEFQKSLDASTARVFAFGATTAVIAGVGSAFKSLVSTTISVQDELIKMNAILGASAKDFVAFREAVFSAAKSTGQSFQTVAAGAQELARQGLNAEETSRRLEAAMVLTRISGLGAEASVKALTAAINGFQSAGLSAVDVTNKIVAVDTRFAVSAQDLAEGFSRAGSTAEDAGVSFDELLGLITAVEQRTARGGAVIGNAFKSIFTRLSRGDTIAELQNLGVQIEATQTGVQKLQALSNALDQISDPTKASAIKELAGGVYQINVVSAALKDLGNEASVFGEATQSSLNAGNDAFERNAELGKSLASQINALVVSVTDLGEKLGSLTLGPLLENLVGFATTASDVLTNLLDGEGVAATFVQGLTKVIGGFLTGPALVLFATAFAKIFAMVTKFGVEGFKSIMAIGTAAETLKNVQDGIVDLLQQDGNLRKTITSQTISQADKERAILTAIKSQNAALAQQRTLMQSIAQSAMRAGVTGYSQTGGFKGKGRRSFAGGLNPYAAEEMDAMMLGATPNVRAYKTNLKGTGPAIVNDQEDIVNIGGKDAVIPRYPAGLGYSGAQVGSMFNRFSKADFVNKFGIMEYNKRAAARRSGMTVRDRERKLEQLKKARNAPLYNMAGEYGMIVPEIGGPSAQTLFVSKSKGSKGITATKTVGPNTIGRVRVPIYRLNKADAKMKTGNKLVEKYTKLFTNDALRFAHSISGGELPKPKTKSAIADTLNKGSATSAAGSIFESGIASMLQDDDFKDFSNRAAGSLMDFKGDSITRLRGKGGEPINPFGIPSKTLGLEAKYSSSLAGGAAEKIFKILGKGQEAFTQKKGKAAGHIPRFAGGLRYDLDQMGKGKEGASRPVGVSRTGIPLPQPSRIAPTVNVQVNGGQSGGSGKGSAGADAGGKALAAGFAMSFAATALGGLASKAEEAGEETKAMGLNIASTALQLGSMGMMFGKLGGGLGLAVGALAAFYKFLDDRSQKEIDENKRRGLLSMANKQANFEAKLGVIRAGSNAGDLPQTFFGLKQLADQQKKSGLGDIGSKELIDLRKKFVEANIGAQGFSSVQDLEDQKKLLREQGKEDQLKDLPSVEQVKAFVEADRAYLEAINTVAKRQANKDELTPLVKIRDELMEAIKTTNDDNMSARSELQQEREREMFNNNNRRSLLSSRSGSLAQSLQAQSAINQDLFNVTDAQEKVNKAEDAFQAEYDKMEADPEALAQLELKVGEASEDFKNKIAEAAVNMQNRMNQISDRQKAVAMEIEQTRLTMVRNSVSFLAESMTAPILKKDNLSAVSDTLKSDTATAQEKGTAALELQTMLSGLPQVIQDSLLKSQGLNSTDLTLAALENILGNKFTDEEKSAMAADIEKADNEKLDALTTEEAALTLEMQSLREKFASLKENFDVEGVVSNIESMNTELGNASSNLTEFAFATSALTDTASSVVQATADLQSILDNSFYMISFMEDQLADVNSKIAALEGKK